MGDRGCCVYHCMSRTVNGDAIIGVREREVLRKMIHQAVSFSGVELLTYVIMDNHFHVLVCVGDCAKEVSDAELVRRFKILYPKATQYEPTDAEVLRSTLAQGGSEADKIRKSLKARMGDVSEFMRTLKQRFTIWFNKSHERYGPLWSDRFKSVIVENDPVVVKTVAAYIDLNPVRAGLVKDPKDYRFCGYAEAVAGNEKLRKGISAVLANQDVGQALADYRVVLFGKDARPKADGSGVDIHESASRKVIEEHGELSTQEQLLQRLRFITEGAVIGSSAFVEKSIKEWTRKIRDRRERKANEISLLGIPNLASFRKSRSVAR